MSKFVFDGFTVYFEHHIGIGTRVVVSVDLHILEKTSGPYTPCGAKTHVSHFHTLVGTLIWTVLLCATVCVLSAESTAGGGRGLAGGERGTRFNHPAISPVAGPVGCESRT